MLKCFMKFYKFDHFVKKVEFLLENLIEIKASFSEKVKF